MKTPDIIKRVGGIEHYSKDSDEGEITYREVRCGNCGKWVTDDKAALFDDNIVRCEDCIKIKYGT